MNRITLAATFLAGALLWWHPLIPWAIGAAVLALLSLAVEPAHYEPGSGAPAGRKRGLVWTVGLGITTWGPFPFITIRRRYH